jgi:drug/metabolite transporter (DMT)-like permease
MDLSAYLGELAAIGTAMLWTLSALAWTSAGRHIGAVAVSFIRLGIACLLLAAHGQLARGLALPSDASARTWLLLSTSGVMGFFVADLCLFKAFLLIGPRLSLLVLSLSPPITAVISQRYLGEPLEPRQWLAMGITLVGIAWVVLEQPDADGAPHPWRHSWLGVALAVLAAVAQSVGLVLSRDGMREWDPVAAQFVNYDAAAGTFIRILGAMVPYLVLLTLFGRWPQIRAATARPREMAILTFGAAVGPYAGVILCMVAVCHCNAGVVNTILATMPVLILPFSIFLHGERVSPRAAGGAAVSMLGVALLSLPAEMLARLPLLGRLF